MAFEITREQITRQANDLLKLFQQTRDKKYKDEELRLRRIVAELEAFASGGGGSQDLQDVTDLGATTTNPINVGGITTDYVQMDTAATPTPVQGMMFWDSDRSTIDVQLDSDVSAKIGQDNFWYVKNQSGATIPKGKAVMAVGTLGTSGRILIDEMVANGTISSKYLLGITAEDIANGADGFVMNIGKLRQVDTSVWPDGTVLYCDASTPGNLTSTKPSSPNLALPIAFVVHSAANGILAVRIQIIDENASGGSTPTLNQVTTAGNRTLNDIYIGLIGSETELSRMTQVNLANERNNFTVANYFSLTNGAVVYRNLSGGADVAPLVNGTTYYIQKIGGTSNAPSEAGFSINIWTGNYPSNQVFLFDNPSFTGTPIRLTQNIPANHFFEQNNRTITNTLFANQDFQIEDGLLFVNAKPYKTGDTHWISPKASFTDSYFDDGEGSFQEVENSSLRESTLLIGPYFEYDTNPIINVQGTIILRSSYYRPFVGVAYGGRNYGITGNLDLPPTGISTTSIGGYFAGMGVKASEPSSSNSYAFGVLASDQTGAGRLSVNFSVSTNKTVNTFNNVLDTPQGLVGINVFPITNSYNYIHIRQQSLGFGSSTIRIDNDSQTTSERSGISFYRSGYANPITFSTILGSLDFFGNVSGTNYTNYVFVDAAQMTIRAVSGNWSTAANRSAQFIWSTRHQNTFAERMRLTSEGNLLINTTTNGTFRLDVNGTARIQNALTLGSLASDPTGSNGMIYYNTTTNKFRGFENGAWVNLI